MLGKRVQDQRLIEIFQLASKKYLIEGGLKSEHWENLNKGKKFAPETLANFQSNDLTRGMLDTRDLSQKSTKLFERILSADYKEIENKYFIRARKSANDQIDHTMLFCLLWLKTLRDSTSQFHKPIEVCEIGSGFGLFPALLAAESDCKHLLLDLPESNLLTARFLANYHPSKTFFLYDDYLEGKSFVRNGKLAYDFIILPSIVLPNIKFNFDLFVNTRSFAEMNHYLIAQYFEFIQNHTREGGYFLNVNRYEKSSYGVTLRLCDYPYDSKWNVIASSPNGPQKHIRIVLAQRLGSGKEGNIASHLKYIRRVGQKYSRNSVRGFVYNLRRKL